MNRIIFTCGFTLFGMFFGAGNLVFPLSIGMNTGENWLLGFLGLIVTGVALPFFGLFAIKLNKGDYFSFFGNAGHAARLMLPAIILTLIGSFGGMPRCIAVAHGGMKQLMPNLSLGLFSLVFCAATYFICMSDRRMINVVGKWMSPMLLLFLIVLVILGAAHPNALSSTADFTPAPSFYHGLTTGYQTMDLLAAFFFSAWIFAQIQQMLPKNTSDKDLLKISMKSTVIAMVMLALVYVGMVFLGANFSSLIANVPPAERIDAIANHLMGGYAALFIGVLIVVACFTTVVALNTIYAKYLCSTFKCEDKFKLVLFATTVAAFLVSLFDFSGIMKILAPVLDVLYPSLIGLTMLSIFTKNQKVHTILFYCTLAAVLLFKVC
ncbi:MAG: branched-chain amino acid transport system II carrier protein [Holosporaceae bacterium]|jgi:LIVCS family branched-chain amino acid:cation transporter|nr:branched-chain amino acid transport system II carrier protein [Holosporaceae bacterium]